MFYHRYAIPSVWEEMHRMRHALTHGFSRHGMGAPREALSEGANTPAVAVWLNAEAAWLTAELPGFDSQTLDVKISGDTLTLSGKRPAEPMPEGTASQRQERPTGQFSRTIQLPFAVQAEQVEAKLENGVLRVRLPRAAADQPRQISVN